MTFDRPAGQCITETVGDFTRVMEFRPGWPLDPEYGRHGMEIWFYLTGVEGTTYFSLMTNWVPGEIGLGMVKSGAFTMANVLGYCWPTRVRTSDEQRSDCGINPGSCFSDSGTLAAVPVFDRFIAEGSDAVWSELESYYTVLCAKENGHGLG